MSEAPLLAVRDLEKHYPVRSGLLRRATGAVKAVDGVSFNVHEGEAVGLVGESGCGKSTVATTILGLEAPTGGSVAFDGDDVFAFDDAGERRFRRRAQMVFQDPSEAFDPRLTVGESVAEPLAIHGLADPGRRDAIVADLVERVGLNRSDLHRYPHELSGGQKQRLALARAVVLNPDLLVADEPVSALDVSVQADILSLLDSLQRELDLSLLLISHDLGVVRSVCDRVAVMYLGSIVEMGPTEAVFADPQHPYTRALIASIPTSDPTDQNDAVELTGTVPDPADPPPGCSFHPRCPRVIPPTDLDIEAEVFRDVFAFRLAVEAGEVAPPDGADSQAVRDRYDLPDALADHNAESTLATAIDELLVGNNEAATERLGQTFTTVCERAAPVLQETARASVAACHLHDDEPAIEPGPPIGS